MNSPKERVIKRLVSDYTTWLNELTGEIQSLMTANIPIDQTCFVECYKNLLLRREFECEIDWLKEQPTNAAVSDFIKTITEKYSAIDNQISDAQERIKSLREDTGSKNYSKYGKVFAFCDELDKTYNMLMVLRFAS